MNNLFLSSSIRLLNLISFTATRASLSKCVRKGPANEQSIIIADGNSDAHTSQASLAGLHRGEFNIAENSALEIYGTIFVITQK